MTSTAPLKAHILLMLPPTIHMKPATILQQLKKDGYQETEARKAIADLIDRNDLVFDKLWQLKANPEEAVA